MRPPSNDPAAADRLLESGEDLEKRARTRHLAFDYAGAMSAYESAYAAYRQEGDRLAAARAARTLGWFRGSVYGDWAVYRAWMARAQSLIEQADDSSTEHGWVLLARAQAGSDLEEQTQLYLAALAVARRDSDSALECEALASLGIMLVLSGSTAEGFGYLDEALIAVCAGEVDDLSVVEGVFCGLFSVCERINDVPRAEQWLRAADALVQRRGLTAVGGYCRAYYGGLLTAAGRWAEAELELHAALQVFPPEHAQFRGSVLSRLAELRLRQGRIEEAAELLRGLEEHEDAQRPLVSLHLARGQTAVAKNLLERALGRGPLEDATEGRLLGLLVDVHLATGALEDARAAADRLTALARNQTGSYLPALAALANGRLCVASGSGNPGACLQEALSGFARSQLPYDAARTQLELARALSDGAPEVAVAHATDALHAFDRVQAARDADAAAALLRSLGVAGSPGRRGPAGLTQRETEVLELLGHALTNAEIAARLFLSPKTVEHHVGRVLAKLGLRTRAQAAAYVVRTGGTGSGTK